jgi:hypothetical protein
MMDMPRNPVSSSIGGYRMGNVLKSVLGLSVLILLASCALSDEGKGDSSYERAKKATGDQQRILQKEAYMRYRLAVTANPSRVSNKLRNRYAEMVLLRANMTLSEGNADLPGIDIFIEDLDKIWSPDMLPANKKSYADFLVQLSDSIMVRGRVMAALSKIDKALEVCDDRSAYTQKRDALVQNLVKQNLDLAKSEFDEGTKGKDEEMLVRAEFHVQVARLFDSTNAEINKLLSDIRRGNTGYYSAYRKVIDPIPDTVIFRKIDKYGILLCIPSISNKNIIEVSMYNYTYNPLRLKNEFFFVVDENGKRYQAGPAPKIEKEILDQQIETKFKLVFPATEAPMKKLIYEAGEYYSEKLFY